MWDQRTQNAIPPQIRNILLTTTPVEKILLFDYPHSYELLDSIAAQYGYNALLYPEKLPDTGKALYQEALLHKSWQGVYPKLITFLRPVSNDKNAQITLQEPLFEKIRQGQVWRIVTPIFLHADILHLFFNMLWVLIIGTQIEARLGTCKYIGFIVLIAIFSNTLQYIMCGPAFLGFSGVICGMVFFIRARQHVAPWEGYQMATATFHFIVFFIGILAGLSTLTFILEFFQKITLPIQIANTAHVSGAMIGWVLGRLKRVFHWENREIQ